MSPGYASRPGGRRSKQRYLPVGPGVLGQVVIHDEHITTLLHELFGHGAPGIGRHVLQGGRCPGLGADDDGVLHGPVALQRARQLRHGGQLLPDGHIDTQHVVPALAKDGVDRHGRLPGLAIPNNQFSLAAADRHQGVHGLDPRVQRHIDRSCAR